MTGQEHTPVVSRGAPHAVADLVEQVARDLDVDPARGLSSQEAASRLASHGPNRLAAGKKEPGWRAFLRQYEDFMQVILLVAAFVNQVVTGEAGTTVVLAGLTVFNAVIGVRQESKAEESVKALAQMMKTIALNTVSPASTTVVPVSPVTTWFTRAATRRITCMKSSY